MEAQRRKTHQLQPPSEHPVDSNLKAARVHSPAAILAILIGQPGSCGGLGRLELQSFDAFEVSPVISEECEVALQRGRGDHQIKVAYDTTRRT